MVHSLKDRKRWAQEAGRILNLTGSERTVLEYLAVLRWREDDITAWLASR